MKQDKFPELPDGWLYVPLSPATFKLLNEGDQEKTPDEIIRELITSYKGEGVSLKGEITSLHTRSLKDAATIGRLMGERSILSDTKLISGMYEHCMVECVQLRKQNAELLALCIKWDAAIDGMVSAIKSEMNNPEKVLEILNGFRVNRKTDMGSRYPLSCLTTEEIKERIAYWNGEGLNENSCDHLDKYEEELRRREQGDD